MMDIDKLLPMVDAGVKFQVMESKVNNDGDLGWEEKCKQAEERFGVLMSMFEKKIIELESLERKHSVLQLEKLLIEGEVQSLRTRNKELEEKVACTLDGKRVMGGAGKGVEGVVDLTEDAGDDKVMELMIENKVLDCEKRKAESEVEVWKAKCRGLESRVLELEKHLISGGGECTLTVTPGTGAEEINRVNGFRAGVGNAATPSVDRFCTNLTNVGGGKRGNCFKSDMESGNQARKQLVFGDEVSPSKKIAPATPAGARPPSLSVIDISDGEGDEKDADLNTPDILASEKVHNESTDYGGGIILDKKQLHSKKNLISAIDQTDEDDVPCQNEIAPSVSSFKRKRAATIVTSDSESDIDDHFPISKLRTNSRTAAASSDKQGEPVVRKRLVALRNLEEKGTSKKSSHSNSKRIQTERLCGILTNKILSDEEEEEEDESDSGEDGFIVHDSEYSEGDTESKDDVKSNSDGAWSGDDFSDETEDGNIDYEAIIARIGRRKDHKVKWEFQADMLAAFAKDARLCMKAVCALYRQQTSEEKIHKATIVCNERGFSQCDAYRGTKLGEFLTDGDPQGDLMKSVEELEAYDPKGPELCRTLATHYSRQLFEIYENNEDPLWPSLQPK
ncbi:hypothetical protein ACH5RR_019758 [Cinchona calisaya]|uniref:Uncharacterized protein n=1 Tax=Cinchona calisaya TaxID=153742 RepID=A0ABD2ZQA7_9GENT